MFKRQKFNNWTSNTPNNIIQYILSPTSNSRRMVNFVFQKLFRINGDVKFMVHYTSIVSGKIYLGKNVVKYMANSAGCYIQGANSIYIGDDTIFAPGVKIISANHNINDFNKHDVCKPIRIGNKCWIGANAVILPGVTLGNNTIVGAGCVVTKSFNSNVVLGGVPAKVIKEL